MARKKKRKKIHFQPKLSPPNYIKNHARKLDIYKVYMPEDIFELAMGNVLVVREKKNGDKVIGGYLVDIGCLGVKDAFYNIMDPIVFEDFINRFIIENPSEIIEAEPNYVFNLIYGALEYAEDLGFSPHKDFEIAQYVLEDVEKIEYVDIEFGKDGRPFYVPGENDNVEKNLKILDAVVGSDRYHFSQLL